MYLSCNDIFDYLVNKDTEIKINDNILGIRRLISRTPRIIISNASPIFHTQNEIKEELNILGMKISSKITCTRGGKKTPGYEHICGFRWKVHVKYEDLDEIPPLLKLILMTQPTRFIFLTTKFSVFCTRKKVTSRSFANLLTLKIRLRVRKR